MTFKNTTPIYYDLILKKSFDKDLFVKAFVDEVNYVQCITVFVLQKIQFRVSINKIINDMINLLLDHVESKSIHFMDARRFILKIFGSIRTYKPQLKILNRLIKNKLLENEANYLKYAIYNKKDIRFKLDDFNNLSVQYDSRDNLPIGFHINKYFNIPKVYLKNFTDDISDLYISNNKLRKYIIDLIDSLSMIIDNQYNMSTKINSKFEKEIQEYSVQAIQIIRDYRDNFVDDYSQDVKYNNLQRLVRILSD